jgi:hypothetical protein
MLERERAEQEELEKRLQEMEAKARAGAPYTPPPPPLSVPLRLFPLGALDADLYSLLVLPLPRRKQVLHGEVNLLEFATGQNPNAADIALTTIVFNGSGFDFIYTRSKVAQAGGLAFAVVWSDTLAPGSWSTSGVSSETVLSDNGTTQQVQVTVPASGVGRRFVRLEVTSP